MTRIFRFLKMSFFLGSLGAGLAMFTSMEMPKNLSELRNMSVPGLSGSGQEFLTKQDLQNLTEVEQKEQQFKAQQEIIKESEQKRAERAIVRHHEVDYVLINGQYYRYNPDNVYLINGVKTFFKPGGYDENRERRAAKGKSRMRMAHAQSSSKLLEGANKLTKNPLKGYSREGIQQMQETLKELQKNAVMRNKMMEQIGN